MRIQNIDNKNLTFGYWVRRVDKVNKTGEKILSHCNTTCFYRIDFGWEKAIKFLVDKYKNIPKVNVYNYGCSNGAEAYSFLMSIDSNFDKSVLKKFSPVIAKDFDSFAIDTAKKGLLAANAKELYDINKYTKNNLDKYLEVYRVENINNDVILSPKEFLKENVIFEQADILKDYKNIEPNNSIIFARNFWVYLSDEERSLLAKKLYNHLDKNCALILGSHDNHQNYQNTPKSPIVMLKKEGFKILDPLELDSYIFIK